MIGKKCHVCEATTIYERIEGLYFCGPCYFKAYPQSGIRATPKHVYTQHECWCVSYGRESGHKCRSCKNTGIAERAMSLYLHVGGPASGLYKPRQDGYVDYNAASRGRQRTGLPRRVYIHEDLLK